MEKQLKNLEDEYKWALETAAAVRAGDFESIDRQALVNELERSIAGGFEQELRQYIQDLLRARLALKLAPDSTDSEENVDLLRRSFERAGSLLSACPSLRNVVTEKFVAEAYEDAKYITGDEIQLPERCPYSPQQILKEAETDIEEL